MPEVRQGIARDGGGSVKRRELHAVAKEIAEAAICTARCAGYEIKPERDVFSYSDMLDLADTIAYWLERHMRPEA
jgi:hypothetical protein